jgi:hypothetical protein
MRLTAAATACPPRTPAAPTQITYRPRPRVSPPGQHATALRTDDPACHQPLLDRGRVTAYRDQRRLRASPHGPPMESGKRRREGRSPPDRAHPAAGDEQGQLPSGCPQSILTVNTDGPPLHAHPECRRTDVLPSVADLVPAVGVDSAARWSSRRFRSYQKRPVVHRRGARCHAGRRLSVGLGMYAVVTNGFDGYRPVGRNVGVHRVSWPAPPAPWLAALCSASRTALTVAVERGVRGQGGDDPSGSDGAGSAWASTERHDRWVAAANATPSRDQPPSGRPFI